MPSALLCGGCFFFLSLPTYLDAFALIPHPTLSLGEREFSFPHPRLFSLQGEGSQASLSLGESRSPRPLGEGSGGEGLAPLARGERGRGKSLSLRVKEGKVCLFFLVWLSACSRWLTAPNHPSQDDDGYQIGRHFQELVVNRHAQDGQLAGQ